MSRSLLQSQDALAYAPMLVGFLALACAQSTTPDACKDPTATKVTGVITQGKGGSPGAGPVTSFPYRVVARVTAGVLVQTVQVGGVSATLSNAATNEWTADLSSADLERKRSGTDAILDLSATTICQGASAEGLDQAVVPIGPGPGVAVAMLSIDVQYAPFDASDGGQGGQGTLAECSVPANQTVAARVVARAARGSAGAKVTLQASAGAFVGGTSSIEVTLGVVDDHAEAAAYWLPSNAGQTLVSAYASGASADPRTIGVTAAPVVSAPTDPLRRGVAYFTTIRSTGYFESCTVETLLDDTVAFELVAPEKRPISGEISLLDLNAGFACQSTKSLRISTTFHEDAPNDARATLHCVDTFGQEGSATLTVAAPDPETGGEGG